MFCKTVWNGLHILPDGFIRLCSIGANSKPELDMQRCRDEEGNPMHILTHEIEDIMNSDKHREVRKLNMENPNAWSPHCDCCENREIITKFNENHPNKSRRIYLMNIQDDVDRTNYFEKASPDGRINWMPSSLDIRFGNLCNQKCIMCGPVFSNMWYDEYFDYFKTNKVGQSTKIEVLKNTATGKWIQPENLKWYEDPRWWPKFENMMPYLRHIYVTGGEPMVVPAHDEMLDRLINSGYAHNIWLEYDTNCSAINDSIAERWSHFKKVHIRGSMDSVGDQYEVIRYPGKWARFQENVRRLKDYEKQSTGKINLLALSTCFQIATMFSIIDCENFCKSMGVNFHLRFLEGPVWHSVASLPDDDKLKLIEYYKKFVDTNSKAPMIIEYLKNHLGDNFYKPGAKAEFIRFMDYLDSTRNQNWRLTFPETFNMLGKI